MTTDGEYNFKNFEVEAPEAGSYYTEFWLLPARLADGSYSTFLVYVNDAYVGAVTPSYGNWQGARAWTATRRSGLSEGKNVITVATPAPEFPEVETLKAAMNDSDAVFSPEAYEEYLGEGGLGCHIRCPGRRRDMLVCSRHRKRGDGAFFKRAPELHLLHDLQLHSKARRYVATSSPAYHKIDMVYYGSASFSPSIVNPVDPNPGTVIPTNPTRYWCGRILNSGVPPVEVERAVKFLSKSTIPSDKLANLREGRSSPLFPR